MSESVDQVVAVDWALLRRAAQSVKSQAYAPYSGFPVGVAALVVGGPGGPDGAAATRIVVGCNVENASYGLGLCAECGLVSALHAGGGGRLVAVSCVGPDGEPLMPCGRCRQLLFEHGGPELVLDSATGALRLGDLLPQAFGPDDLSTRGSERPSSRSADG